LRQGSGLLGPVSGPATAVDAEPAASGWLCDGRYEPALLLASPESARTGGIFRRCRGHQSACAGPAG